MKREELEALWGQLSGDTSDKEFVQTALETLKGKAHWLFQAIFNQGHSAATAENKGTIERLEGELATATKAAEKERKAREKAEAENPDAAKVRAELETQISTLTADLEAERTGRKQDRIDGAKRRAMTDLTALVSSRLTDPVLARAYAAEHADRIRVVLNEDGTERVEVLQNGLSIPMTQEKPLEALADEVKGKVDVKYHATSADRGGGSRGGSGGSGPTGGTVYDRIREKAEQERKQAEERTSERSGAKRLGVLTTQ